MQTITNNGKCYLCGGTFAKRSMGRHLASCLAARQTTVGQTKVWRAAERTFHLVVEDRYTPYYWLFLNVSAKATLGHLDAFLRRIWLECCGHLSSFNLDGVSYDSHPEIGDEWMDGGSENMRAALGHCLAPQMVLKYTYDFGTSSELAVRVLRESAGLPAKRPIQILARNDAPAYACGECGQPATRVCSCCFLREYLVCDHCGQDHECGEECLLPLVNSPRAGMCGYCGPSLEE